MSRNDSRGSAGQNPYVNDWPMAAPNQLSTHDKFPNVGGSVFLLLALN